MQIKTAIRYYHIPIRMAKLCHTEPPNAAKDVGQQEHSFITDGNAKWYSHFGRQFGNFLLH